MSSVTFDATLLEVAKAHLRDAFLLVQPPLTRAIKAIFVRQFGAGEWLSKFKSYLGRSMQDFAVDDGRAFDMYASLLLRSVLWTGPVGRMNALLVLDFHHLVQRCLHTHSLTHPI